MRSTRATWRGGVVGVGMPVYYDAIYTHGLSDEARFPKFRYELTHADLLGRAAPVDLRPAPLATRDDALEAHAAGYVDAFLDGRLDTARARRIGLTPWTASIRERTLRLLGGSLAALEDVARGAGLAGNLGGGTHHAHRQGGAGYCVFNDLAVMARRALRRGWARQVMILDLDVHQGDGTATILASEPRAVTISVHCRANFPFRKSRSDVDISLPPGTGDHGLLTLLEQRLDRWLDLYAPDLVLVQAGVDGLEQDRLGRWALTRRGLRSRNARVLDAVWRQRRIPMVWTMGGGYGRPIEASVPSLADGFDQAARARAEAAGPGHRRGRHPPSSRVPLSGPRAAAPARASVSCGSFPPKPSYATGSS